MHLKPGKTAAVVRAMGVGAKELLEALPSMKMHGVTFDSERALKVCVTDDYKHLGCVLQEDGGLLS